MVLPPNVSAAQFASALGEFKAAVGSEWVFTSDEDVALYRDSYSIYWDEPEERVASAAVAPAKVEEVQQAVAIFEIDETNEYFCAVFIFLLQLIKQFHIDTESVAPPWTVDCSIVHTSFGQHYVYAGALQDWMSSQTIISHSNVRQIRHKPEHVQEPNDDEDHHDRVQYGLNRPLHWDKIDEPQKNSHCNQSHHYLNERHRYSFFLTACSIAFGSIHDTAAGE